MNGEIKKMSLIFNSEEEKENYKNRNPSYYLDDKLLCLEWGKEFEHENNLFFQDLIEDFDSINKDERFIMASILRYREDNGLVYSRSERNLERFELKKEIESNRIESDKRLKETIRKNTLKINIIKFSKKVFHISVFLVSLFFVVRGLFVLNIL